MNSAVARQPLDAGEQLLESFVSANADERQVLLELHPELAGEETVQQLLDRAREQLRVDFARSQASADAALAAARYGRSALGTGRALRARANALCVAGHNPQALEDHRAALSIFEDLHDSAELALTQSAAVQPLLLLGEYEAAMAAAERADALFEKLGDERRRARLSINIGNILHRQDRFNEAVERYQVAVERLAEMQDTEGVAGALSNMAVCLISMNDFERALASYRRAREIAARSNMPLLAVQADYNIAFLYYLRGEYSRAIDGLRDVRIRFERNGDAYHLALCDLDLAEIYIELNLSDEAEELASRAASRFEELGMGYEAAKAQTYVAIATVQQGRAFLGLELFERARRRFEQEKNETWCALCDVYQSTVLAAEGRIYESRRICRGALDFFERRHLPAKAIFCRLVLVRLAIAEQDFTSAHTECSAVLQSLEDLDLPSLAYQAWLLLGRVECARGETHAGYAAMQQARRQMEVLRGRLRIEELKISFLADKLEVYENLVSLCLDESENDVERAKWLREAFEYTEEAKCRTLLESLFSQMQFQSDDESSQSELARRVRGLREELNWYYHRLQYEGFSGADPSPDVERELRSKMRQRENEFAHLMRDLTHADAAIYSPASLPLEEIQATLAADSVLVTYFRVQEQIVAAVLERQKLRFVPVTLSKTVEQLLTRLRYQLSKFRLGPAYVERYRATLQRAIVVHLQALYNELLLPLGRLDASHLVLVPYEGLHHLPFHALHDGSAYLAERFTMSYAPSAGIFAVCRQLAASRGMHPLILGVPDERAPLIQKEVLAVSGALPGADVRWGSDAGLEALRTAGAQANLVHISAHAAFREDAPRFSGIRLGDGYVSTYDLYRMRVPADLVTLSGCATGVSGIAVGGELIGLERAFLCAGARSVLISLWEVDDRATAELMAVFYRELAGGATRAEALVRAMCSVRELWPHPYYWAPFLLVGQYDGMSPPPLQNS
jgi:CHAT domain-containing protein/Tfp pilus assembly protein PilF